MSNTPPQFCFLGAVTEAELAQRRLVHGLSGVERSDLPLLRRLLQRRAMEVCERAAAELLLVPWAGLAGAPELTGLVSPAALDALLAAATEPAVADERSRLGARHAWLGLDAHAVSVVAEALCQSVDLALADAGAGPAVRGLFRRVAALDAGLRFDAFVHASARLAAAASDEAVLSKEGFLRATTVELARCFRRADCLTVIVASTPNAAFLAGRARLEARPGDVVGRIGPEEIAIALTNADEPGARAFASRWLGDEAVTVRVGVASCIPGATSSAADLLEAALHRIQPIDLEPTPTFRFEEL